MVKLEIRLWYFCGQTKNHRQIGGDFPEIGGLEGDRTLDLCDAKLDVKFFLIILNTFKSFLFYTTSFPELFELALSVCFEGVCGGDCGQKRSPSFAGSLRRQGMGAFSNCCRSVL